MSVEWEGGANGMDTLPKCETCDGTGENPGASTDDERLHTGACPTCDGRGYEMVDGMYPHGTVERQECEACKGQGRVPRPFPGYLGRYYETLTDPCPACNGTGVKP